MKIIVLCYTFGYMSYLHACICLPEKLMCCFSMRWSGGGMNGRWACPHTCFVIDITAPPPPKKNNNSSNSTDNAGPKPIPHVQLATVDERMGQVETREEGLPGAGC